MCTDMHFVKWPANKWARCMPETRPPIRISPWQTRKWILQVTGAFKLHIWNTGFGVVLHSLYFNKRPVNKQKTADLVSPRVGTNIMVKIDHKNYKIWTDCEVLKIKIYNHTWVLNCTGTASFLNFPEPAKVLRPFSPHFLIVLQHYTYSSP